MPLTNHEIKIIDRVLVVAPQIAEIGAHKGDAVKQYLKIRPNAKVHAYEPSPYNYEELRQLKNDNVSTYPFVVVADYNGDCAYEYFVSKKQGRCNSLFESVMKYKDKKHYKSDIARPFNIESAAKGCDFVRLDCYGGEYEIFKNETWHQEIPIIMTSLHVKPHPFDLPEYKKKRNNILEMLKKTHTCVYNCGGGHKHIRAIWEKK